MPGRAEARFVARQSELALFKSALAAERPPFTVLHVHGPGGVGKTTLLREFARLARDAHRTVIALDGRDIPPSRQALLRALDEALGGGGTSGAARLAVPDRSLVLIDTYEALSTLDTWLRDTLLPDLPAGVIVVLAGRGAPALPWRTDVAWAALTRIIELGNFAPGRKRGVPRVPRRGGGGSRERAGLHAWPSTGAVAGRRRARRTAGHERASIRIRRRTSFAICSACFSTPCLPADSGK